MKDEALPRPFMYRNNTCLAKKKTGHVTGFLLLYQASRRDTPTCRDPHETYFRITFCM